MSMDTITIPDEVIEPTEPTFAQCENGLVQPEASAWCAFSKPYPTNVWWNPVCLEGGCWTIGQLPYNVQAKPDMLSICYPDFLVSEKYVIGAFQDNLSIGVKEGLASKTVICSSLLSVTLLWSTATGGGQMELPLVQGCPFITCIFSNATPLLTTIHAIMEPYNARIKARRFLMTFNTGQKWVIYSSKDIVLTFSSNPASVAAEEPFTGVLRVAVLPSEDYPTKALDDFHDTYPVSGDVKLSTSGNKGCIEFQYQTASLSETGTYLLMMALPHHIETGLPNQTVMPASYRTIKGRMTGVLGRVWTMLEDLPCRTWTSGNPIDHDKREAIRGALLAEEFLPVNDQNPYWFGKRIAMLARLALIADELEELHVAKKIRKRMKGLLKPWLEGTNEDAFVYDCVWGGLVSKDGVRDKNADYGNAMYNDHHFQYGYFIYAIAVLGKEKKNWLRKNRRQALDLVRDYANPNRHDPYFPIARHMDFYAGHSWAGGLFCFNDDKNQESSSEAVNAYYALWLLGLAMEDEQLAAFGRILTAIEIRSAKTYWQIMPGDTIYPHPFSENRVVGIMWGTKVDFGTWFGSNLEFIYCIQFLPFTPITEDLLGPEWVKEAYEVIKGQTKEEEVGASWKGFIYMLHAILDKEKAWEEMRLMEGPHDSGNCTANALYWVATRPDTNVNE